MSQSEQKRNEQGRYYIKTTNHTFITYEYGIEINTHDGKSIFKPILTKNEDITNAETSFPIPTPGPNGEILLQSPKLFSSPEIVQSLSGQLGLHQALNQQANRHVDNPVVGISMDDIQRALSNIEGIGPKVDNIL